MNVILTIRSNSVTPTMESVPTQKEAFIALARLASQDRGASVLVSLTHVSQSLIHLVYSIQFVSINETVCPPQRNNCLAIFMAEQLSAGVVQGLVTRFVIQYLKREFISAPTCPMEQIAQ